ncbi:MAG: 2-oxoacid:acceptor oxidoreductase subunit alpha, partial [Thermodesulfovibrionales bacterium]|nr:2-oxoacid:acceptor oxidoreductase subunit alpha [Thermodesulfovibrionales bacterium]
GISPLAVPGESEHLVVTDSDEHDEEGHIVEDAETRIKMVEKRLLRKFPLLQREIEPPLIYGNENPEIILICWGSTYGVVKECVDQLSDKYSISMLHFSEIWPFPLRDKFDYLAFVEKAKKTVCIEHNATSQFARLFRSETGYSFHYRINKFDGRPFTVEELIRRILNAL